MSLAAAMLVASASAIDNIKISGDAKVYYGTFKDSVDNSNFSGTDKAKFFKKDSSMADTALRLGVTADLLPNLSFGATAYAVSTLGLENNMVDATWTGGHRDVVEDNGWLGELWLAYTMGKTTAKVGRMELDTPLAFSEKWNIAPNTFDAAVLINQDIPDTTLVAAWVGKDNSGNGTIGHGVVTDEAKFSDFVIKGAYAVGAINNSFKPLTAQAWYYNVKQAATAWWLQADLAGLDGVPGLVAGLQYTQLKPKEALAGKDKTKAWAGKLGYGIDGLNAYVAYSKVKDVTNPVLDAANVASGFGESKLYTEFYMFTNHGEVGAADSKTWKIAADYDAKDFGKYLVSYTQLKNDHKNDNHKIKEFAVEGAKSFGPLDTSLAYSYTKDRNDAATNRKEHAIIAKVAVNF